METKSLPLIFEIGKKWLDIQLDLGHTFGFNATEYAFWGAIGIIEIITILLLLCTVAIIVLLIRQHKTNKMIKKLLEQKPEDKP